MTSHHMSIGHVRLQRLTRIEAKVMHRPQRLASVDFKRQYLSSDSLLAKVLGMRMQLPEDAEQHVCVEKPSLNRGSLVASVASLFFSQRASSVPHLSSLSESHLFETRVWRPPLQTESGFSIEHSHGPLEEDQELLADKKNAEFARCSATATTQ